MTWVMSNIFSNFQVSAPNWAGYLTSMGVTQSGVYSNYWTPIDGNPPGKAEHLPPISGRGLPQTLFSVVKAQNPNATVSSFARVLADLILLSCSISSKLFFSESSKDNCVTLTR